MEFTSLRTSLIKLMCFALRFYEAFASYGYMQYRYDTGMIRDETGKHEDELSCVEVIQLCHSG